MDPRRSWVRLWLSVVAVAALAAVLTYGAPRDAAAAQATVTVVVPSSGASAWTRSTLVRVASLGILGSATSSDTVVLCGTNDPSVPIAATGPNVLMSFAGGQSLQNVGVVGEQLGAFAYFAVFRTGGTSAGLSFVILGDDGGGGSSASDAGTPVVIDGGRLTADQGAPNAGGVNSWPTVDLSSGPIGGAVGDVIAAGGEDDVLGTRLPFTFVPCSSETHRAGSNCVDVQIGGQDQILNVTAASLPLPAGAATAANQTNGNQKTQVVASDGSQLFPIASAPANGTSNGAVTAVACRDEVQNLAGTWDQLQSGQTTPSGSFTGFANVLPWSQYLLVPTTRTSGQGGPLLSDAAGNLLTVRSTGTSVHSTALEANHLLSTSAQTLVSLLARVDLTLATGTYYVMVVVPSGGACPGNGAVTLIHSPIQVNHVVNATNYVTLDDSGGPIQLTAAGACAALSTTDGTTLTSAGSFAMFDATVR